MLGVFDAEGMICWNPALGIAVPMTGVGSMTAAILCGVMWAPRFVRRYPVVMAKCGISLRRVLVLAILLSAAPALHAAGVMAPRFDLSALDGKRYTERYLIGRPTLVVFWASWCPVCRVELPKIHALFEAAAGRGLQVLAIAFADDEVKVRQYVRTHATMFDFPVLYDPHDVVAKRFGVTGTPTIYLINGRGEIDYVTWLIEDPKLAAWLENLLPPRNVDSQARSAHRFGNGGLTAVSLSSARGEEPAAEVP